MLAMPYKDTKRFVVQIGEGLKSNNIIVVRKGLELLWRNVHVTDVASTVGVNKNFHHIDLVILSNSCTTD